MKTIVTAAFFLLSLQAMATPIDCRTDKSNAKECAEFRERVKKEDARRLATYNAVNAAHPTPSLSKAVTVKKGVNIGMSMQDALASTWGKPNKVNRTTTATQTREQWVYDEGYLYFVNGILTTIQN